MAILLDTALVAAALLLAAATALPLLDSPRWWIRAAEFPRLHIAVLLALLLAAAIWRGGWPGLAAGVLSLVALGWQLRFILPYTPLHPLAMRAVPAGSQGDDVTLMALNVLMENDDHAAVAAEIARADPDVLLLMETDDAWTEALAPVLERYATVRTAPLDNHYGMIFATRLEARSAELVRLTEDVTPTAFAELVTPGGTRFRFVGLHPVPPVPGEDTAARDAQVLYAARYAHNSGSVPVVAMGDFNTVAWSRIAHRFKWGGGYVDPRVGRGPLCSFDTRSRIFRFPIDQFYVTAEIALVGFSRGPAVGSDHFPMHAVIRFDADLAARLNRAPLPLGEADMELIESRISAHKERLDRR